MPAIAPTVPKAADAAVIPSAATPSPDAAAAPAALPAEPAPRFVRTIYGDMHDILTGQSYGLATSEVLKHSTWIDSQIAAGKMEMVS